MVRSLVVVVLLAAVSGCGNDSEKSEDAGSAPVRPTSTLSARELDNLVATGAASDMDVLIVTFDTTRADRLKAYGHDAALNPTIDRLAKNGVLFEHAFTPAPITLPSHASLMTGLYPGNHGVRNNGTFRLGADPVTLAERFSGNGWKTAAFVGAFVLDARFGLDRGFSRYDDETDERKSGTHSHYAERTADKVTDAALTWLKSRQRSDRLFYWVHYFDPHAPFEPPEEFRGLTRDRYDGEIAFTDREFGRLIHALEKLGRLDRTLVVFTADHGEGLGEHDEDSHAYLVHDSTIRVPLVISNPKLFPRQERVADRVASLVDIVPTLLDLTGQPALECDGIHLFRTPKESDRAVFSETMLTFFNHGWAPLYTLRRLNDKFIESPAPEYFRLDDDPGEINNLFDTGDGNALRAMLRRRLEAWGGVQENAARESPLDPETERQLAALGYVRTRSSSGPAGLEDPKRMLGLWKRSHEAFELVDAGRSDEALKRISHILAGDPENGEAWYIAAHVYRTMGKIPKAEACQRKAIALFPRVTGYTGLAEICFQQSKFKEGNAALENARELDPKSGYAYLAEGLRQVKRRDWPGARRLFRMALEADRGSVGKRARENIERIDRIMSGGK